MYIGDILENPTAYSLEKLAKSTSIHLYTFKSNNKMKITQGGKIKVHAGKIQENLITASTLKEMHADHDVLDTTVKYGIIGDKKT